jgi:hypothetical protein
MDASEASERSISEFEPDEAESLRHEFAVGLSSSSQFPIDSGSETSNEAEDEIAFSDGERDENTELQGSEIRNWTLSRIARAYTLKEVKADWIQNRIDESIQVFREPISHHVIIRKNLLQEFVGDMHATGHGGTKTTMDSY